MDSDLIQRLVTPAQTKIVMLIMDGLGGLPREPGGKTELETANTPNLEALAERSNLGLTIPVAPGITPGSGPGHLALFGYDPIQHEIGRGAMEALGVDFELGPDDLAARGNYCTVGSDGCIIDRRAGRISTEVNRHLSSLLSTIKLAEAETFIEPVKEHRFAFILRAAGLDEALTETDPQKTGIPPWPVSALDDRSQKAASLANQFIDRAQKLLEGQSPANMILLRGFARPPALPAFQERYGLHAAAIAVNGMYRGVARLVGMQVLPLAGPSLQDEFEALEQHWDQFDFFYLHVKQTDTCGEQGDFEGKVKAIETVDAFLPRLMALRPDVVIVGGDHSSPAVMKFHSWHPVPLLVYSHFICPDGTAEFGERACSRGSLGTIPATSIMPIALANARRLEKYGA
ncbi:MAG: 2,3-bisphosphoglycerate-independent phosphoglycerate mutase [Anaerolineae bacterium]|nr:2,3-bisphosphoglycerate-independent phosphoglycerate mutase [Anaerolineae bacterium]